MSRCRWIVLGSFVAGLLCASVMGAPVVYVDPAEASAGPGEPVTFELWIRADAGTFDLRGYQLSAPCSLPIVSGGPGAVDSPVFALDMDNADWVMHLTACAGGDCGVYAEHTGACNDPPAPRIAFGGNWGESVTVDTAGYYLAEVTYQIDEGTENGTVFSLDVVEAEVLSFLRDSANAAVPATWEGATLTVQAGQVCDTVADCYDGDLCKSWACVGGPPGICEETLIPSRPYADVYPVADGDGAVEIMDTLCILDAASGVGDCLTDVGGFMLGDIYPCPPPEGGGPDGAVEIMDTLAVLDAAAGNPGCSPWCP